MRTASCIWAVLLTAYSAPSFAQIEGGGAAEGGATTGIPIGEKSRIHTELTLGVAFDSNVQRNDPDLVDRDPDGRLLIRPGIGVDVPGQSLRLGFATHASINYFFGVGNSVGD